MNLPLAVESIQHALTLALLLAAPLLLTSLLVGLIVSLVQAVTQLQEQTLTFIPKLAVVALVFVVTLPWLLAQLTQYVVAVLQGLPSLAG